LFYGREVKAQSESGQDLEWFGIDKRARLRYPLATDMKLVVRVPATTANLGPGFDCLGLALQIWNTIAVEESPKGVQVRLLGDSENLALDRSNLVLLSMEEVFRRSRRRFPNLRVTMTNRIPIGRGLGSSAAAIAGGVVAANAWAGEKLSPDQLLALATELEGHPDNVSAALLGGLTIVVREGEKTSAAKVRPPRGWRAVLFIPGHALSTKFAREILPTQITREDAIYNIGRAALLVRAFSAGDVRWLDLATGDRLHEPYRAPHVPGMDELCEAARRAGAHGVALSGAGPSMVAFAANELDAARVARAFERCARDLKIEGEARSVGLSPRGAYARVV
jgi:homoserine kinase